MRLGAAQDFFGLEFHLFDILDVIEADVFHHHQPSVLCHLRAALSMVCAQAIAAIMSGHRKIHVMENVNQIHLPIVAKITTKYHQQCGLAFIFASSRFI